MDWKQAIREERTMLKSIVALLLSLADLADLASQRSLVVCRLLLLLLRPAEIAVRECIVGASDPWPMDVVGSGDARADMVHLAMRLRELACLFQYEEELVLSCRPRADIRSLRSPRAIGLIMRAAQGCMMAVALPLAPVSDTS